MTFNLNGRMFKPLQNSEGGRVDGDTLFRFSQSGQNITAHYNGPDVFDGHIIGQMHGEAEMKLLYHSRARTGELEAGEAKVKISRDANGNLRLAMNWAWLNGSKKTGTSNYIEVSSDEREKTQ
ncbi:MAG: hypothetical protein ABJN22_03755 [Litorimonas sp.]